MTDNENHEMSAHTETRTQRSPNPHRNTNRTDYDFQQYRMKQQFRRELENCHRQIQILKEELYNKNQQIDHLNTNVILKLKQELNEAHKQKIKHYQESEKTRKQIQRLKNDNYSMQQQVDRGIKDRRAYYSKLEDLKEIKQATKRELFENQKIIKNYSEQNRRLEKQVAALRMDLDQMNQQLREKEKKLFQTDSEYKVTLQRNFVVESELRNLQLRQKDQQSAMSSYRQQINHLEKEKEDLLDRIEEIENSSHMTNQSQVKISGMVEVRSLMDQIYGLLEDRGRDKKELQKKFLKSMAGLEKSLMQR